MMNLKEMYTNIIRVNLRASGDDFLKGSIGNLLGMWDPELWRPDIQLLSLFSTTKLTKAVGRG